MNTYLRCLWIAGLLAVVGCEPNTGGFDYAPVSGTVTVNGRPLEGATVAFAPQGESLNTGRPSLAQTDADGHFQLQTVNGIDGAVIGRHLVAITTKRLDPETQDVVARETIPVRYNAQSELSFDVPKEGSTSANFDLTLK
ncbi:carboxypeptidase-like regulatory domain-containing protein [Blastopirellula sp. JC732]|uniref:Carboxypeptidase-like regulatory domain-containing protein n=1 Tax=Blastopirellula sediminis TaxID=2894196 RepID=A0A9X1ML14_9BACT|nr:carboxypeptidase-like regulatory domain-containing protein [Blastopirellula sediminis]MCC9607738.1 carboxypeptidase-like regulatory domain-containing protein [Blastopirellula sediminis]MCC9627469.1 carboxypeptidase-like regulatory domain-containing protein [Blastopirellula sediminis]